MFVSDSLTTENIEQAKISEVDQIEANVNEIVQARKNKKFQRIPTFSFFKKKQIQNEIEYVTYAYTFYSHSLQEDFYIHRPQIYTVIQACNKLLRKNCNFWGLSGSPLPEYVFLG